ncbi:MAG: TrkH family potassium uptake protein [Magnetospiraceae bacterium]
MSNLRPSFHILGWVICIIGGILLVPASTDYLFHDLDWEVFVGASAVSFYVGISFVVATKDDDVDGLNFRQAFFLIFSGWIVVTLFGAIPFFGYGLTFTDSIFETMSGLTTTGSTILSGLDSMPPGILLWRAILQWIGGIGIIAIAVLLLPMLRVGGMQIFKIENSGTQKEKSEFTARTLIHLSTVYGGLTLACALVYRLLGMNSFDALTHAMATLSTGGYSTHDASFGYFDSFTLHWAGTIFMACGAIPFFLFVKFTLGNFRVLVTDQQVRGFVTFLILSSVGMAFWLMNEQDVPFGEALTLTAFNITSVVTTTGFATDDYTAWGHGAIGMFLILMFVGGCSGSTSGSIKIYRYQILWMFVRSHVRKLFSPHRIIVLKYNGRPLEQDVPLSVLAFLAVFIASIALFTVALSLMDIDLVTAYSASVTAITNVGPGMGPIIGPVGNFEPLPDAAKWVLICAMLAGRLEVLALLVIFERDFWAA